MSHYNLHEKDLGAKISNGRRDSIFKHRALIFFGGGSALILLIAVTFFGRDAPDPALFVGTYESECCGEITVSENDIAVGSRRVSFEVGQDNFGAFLLPADPIGVVDERLDVYPSRNLRKLRVNSRERPSQIEVIDFDTYEEINLNRR